jgi:hypothetical protein
MSISAYRIKSSITAVILRGASERFQCLNGGSILIPMSGPDAAGMIEAKYEGDRVLVFKRDLTEACERIEIEAAAS